MDKKALWEKAAAFHGHVCGGLTIGYKAALYAIELLGLEFSDDEQVVCISENDACGVLSLGDTLYINIIRNIREPELEYHLHCVLRDMGIPVEVQSNARL